MSDRLYRLSEAAALRGLPRGVLYAAAHAGQLPVVRFSPRGRYRVTLGDVDAFIAAHRVSEPTRIALPTLPVAHPRELRRADSADLSDLMPATRRFS